MQTLKNNLPIIFLIILEIVVGIFLLVNPDTFTRVVIIIFGIVMLLVGLSALIRYLRGRKSGAASPLTLIGAIIGLILGAICLFASGVIIGLISIIAIVYGIILIIAGCFKIQSFFDARRAGFSNSGTVLLLVSGIIMIVFGIILVFHPFGTIEVLLQIGGIVLIAEAVIDLVTLILAIKNAPREVG